MRFSRTMLVALLTLSLLGVSAGVASAAGKAQVKHASLGTVVVGNEGFTESDIMQNIYGLLLQHLGYKVTYQSTAGRTAALPALEAGKIDVLPDYAGSLLLALNPKAQSQAGTISSAEAADNALLKAKGATVLPGTAGLDQNVFVVTDATQAKYHLSTISSIKPYASKWDFGAPPECTTYYFCYPGLKSVYGLTFKKVLSLDESGPLTVAALKSGTANVVELFSTDNVISSDKFYVLSDNKNLEPADHLVAIVRNTLDTAAVQKALESVNMDLTTSTLTQLDAAASGPTKPTAAQIAEGFLTTEKLLP